MTVIMRARMWTTPVAPEKMVVFAREMERE
jgi:hypothetical protein